jgi:eukaryotic-like serine/threonine-protein kinase
MLTGSEYRVGKRLGAGGFGAAYQVTHTSGSEGAPGECCLKVAANPREWHREAYFGDLLREVPGVVKVHESFAWIPSAKNRKPVYCLVTELVEGGDLAHYLNEHPVPWPESKARREMIRLLRTVTLLHAAGAVHRDITCRNVLVSSDGALKLGDFGIALHRVGERDVRADVFNRKFAPTAIGLSGMGSWRPADDVYYLGQLFATLLCGHTQKKLTAADVRLLECSPEAKAVIQRLSSHRGNSRASFSALSGATK